MNTSKKTIFSFVLLVALIANLSITTRVGLANGNILTETPIINAQPIAEDDIFITDEDVPLQVATPGVLANDSDPNGDVLTATLLSGPVFGTVSLDSNGGFIYTPIPNYSGVDSFTYTASDGVLTDTATVSLTITSVFDPPSLSAFPRIGVASLEVMFTNLSFDTGPTIWNYGDGVTSTITATAHTHAYDAAGLYTVTISVQDTGGTPYTTTYPAYVAVYASGGDNIYYVDTIGGSDATGDGSQNAPWKTITYSLNQMYGTPLELRAASGEYTQSTGESFPIIMKSGISVTGVGYPFSIAEGISSEAVFSFPGTALFDPITVLSGFEIRGGNYGVAVSGTTNYDTAPTIRDNLIDQNGYGIYVYTSNGSRAMPVVENNQINNNQRGLYLYASHDEALVAAEIRGNFISENTLSGVHCYSIGSGVAYGQGDCDPIIFNNIIVYNGTNGVVCQTSYAGHCSPWIEANLISNNGGWGFERSHSYTLIHYVRPIFVNNMIFGNVSGGAHFINGGDSYHKDAPTFVNNTIAFNGDYGIQNGYPLSIVNSIVWGHTSDLNASVGVVSYSDISQGPYPGQNNNVSIDPQFIDPSAGDFHLQFDSPIINLGNNAAPNLPATDFDGDPRIVGGTVDMGADEIIWEPNAVDDAFQILEDTLIFADVLANDSDPAGDVITIESVDDPPNGQAIISGTVIAYTPDANIYGLDVFAYTIENEHGAIATATVTITVLPVNDAPVAFDDNYSTDEDIPLYVTAPGLLGNDNDIDDPVLTATLITLPSIGDLTLISSGAFTYTPTLNYNGTVTFTYNVSDAQGGFDLATVFLDVVPVNDSPLADDAVFTTTEDVPYSSQLIASDVDEDPLTFAVDTLPLHGSVILQSSGVFTYTSDLNYYGSDSFSFVVSDGDLSDDGQVTIMIDSVNDAPITNEQIIITLEDTPYIGALNAFDPDADPLTFGVDTLPLHGSLDLQVGGVFTYTPNLNYNGTDVFTFTVSDGIYSTIGHVDIFVISVNDDPIVSAGDDLNITEGNLAVFSGSFSDSGLLLEAESIQWYFGDGETVTGTLTPSHIYGDNDIFTVTLVVTDDQGGVGSDWLLVTVENVEPQLDTISNQTVAVGSTLGVTATFNDPGWLDSHTVVIQWGDGISETFVIPAGGVSLELSHTFTEVGVYSATLTINDDDGEYDFLTFSVTVSPISYSSMLPLVKK